jgi:hypothetical protein
MEAQAEATAPVADLSDEAASRQLLIAQARKTLRLGMIEAMAGRAPSVPVIRTTLYAGPLIEAQPLPIALLESLDLSVCEGKLRSVLRDSACPLVADLRTAIANAYADAQAPLMVSGARL